MPFRLSFLRLVCMLAALLVPAWPGVRPAAGQAPLILVNEETEVRGIAFKFETTRTFEDSRLQSQIATTEPGFMDRLKKVLPLMDPAPHPFSPVELQKDVVRLRRFYARNGFLHPHIDYGASQLDTTSNTIRVIFSIREGPPVIIQDVGFFGPDSQYAVYQFPESYREGWNTFRDRVSVRTGDRYTEFDRLRIQDQVLVWLKDNGFAFATLRGEASIDSLANTADLRFFVDPGPVAYYDSIQVEGNRSVARSVILRELPFKSGQRFSNKKLSQAQRELFSLSLFRVALTDVPEQARDSTVDVRVRVREAPLRYVTAQTGYGREDGLALQSEWTHRNFGGGARTFTAAAIARTGFFATPSGATRPSRLFRGSVTLRQPYLGSTRLSGSISPFIQLERNTLLPESEELLNINAGEAGNTTSLVYEIHPFRTVSAQHTFSRVLRLASGRAADSTTADGRARDVFNRSIFSFNAILGKVNNFIYPDDGFLVRPFVETAGTFFGSDLDYLRTGVEATAYMPVAGRTKVAGRLYLGQLWPQGEGGRALAGHRSASDSLLYENRFDPVFFYLGGSNDLRGWGNGVAGKKTARRDVVKNAAGGLDTLYTYEAAGGKAKLGTNLELRLPFPGLGAAWHTALFFDAGAVGDRLLDTQNWRYGTGVGIRYETIVGYIRLDIGYKINPDFEDLRDEAKVYLYRNGLIDYEPKEHWMKRVGLHLSIGQAF